MTIVEMIDEVMVCSGPISVHKLIPQIREMFCVRLTAAAVSSVLEAEPSFVQVGFDSYGLDRPKRAERLVEAFGLRAGEDFEGSRRCGS